MDEQQKHINEFDEIRSRIRSNDPEGDKNFIPGDSVWDGISVGIGQQRSKKKLFWLFLFIFLFVTAIFLVKIVFDGNENYLSHHTVTEEKVDLPNTWIENEGSNISPSMGQESDESNIEVLKEYPQKNKPLNNWLNNSKNDIDNNTTEKAEEWNSESIVAKTLNNKKPTQIPKDIVERNDIYADKVNHDNKSVQIQNLPIINAGIVHNDRLLDNISNVGWITFIQPIQNMTKNIFMTGSIEYFRSGYQKTYQSSSNDHFELNGRNGWGLAFDLGIRLKRNFYLSAGVFYRKINFDAEYGFTMENQAMDINRDINGDYIASYNRSIPSLAGGLRTEIYTSYRSGAAIPAQDVGFNLSLAHAYRTISFPLTVQYITGISEKVNAELGIGGSYTHRYVSIDTDIKSSGYNQSDYSLNDIQFSALENDVMPFKSNYFTGIINVGLSFEFSPILSLHMTSRAERSLENIYRDEELTVNNANLSLLLGLRYSLK